MKYIISYCATGNRKYCHLNYGSVLFLLRIFVIHLLKEMSLNYLDIVWLIICHPTTHTQKIISGTN